MNEARERDVRRIEAFSDVVIGFSLAQVGIALAVPLHAASLVEHIGWFIAFLWTFALVCLLWWNHHRLFRSVFVPTPLAVVLNFVLLATIVLLSFLADVLNRANAWHDVAVAARLYYGALGTNFALWALLAAICARDPEHAADVAKRRAATRSVIVNGISGVVLIVIVLASAIFLDDTKVVPVVSTMVPVGFILGAIVANLAGYRRARET